MSTPKPCEKCGHEYFPLRRGYCHRCDMHRRNLYGYQCSYVDAEPVRARVQELKQAGLSYHQICRLSGISRSALQGLMRGKSTRGGKPCARVTAKTEKAIMSVPLPDVLHRVVAGGEKVPAIGTVRRVQSLVAFGYTQTYLSQRIGWQVGNFNDLTRYTTEYVNASTACKVEALFNELQLTPGPSQRARDLGRRNGWMLPFQWDEDEIDRFTINADDESVDDDRPISFVELYGDLDAVGYTHRQIMYRMGELTYEPVG